MDFPIDRSRIPKTGRILIGFSGGADSTALVHAMQRGTDPRRILCLHVNHGLRGAEARADQEACEAFCRELGLDFRAEAADVAAYAAAHGLGLEEAGRALRYELYRRCAPEPTDCILTAHNANDNAETVLMNLIRGTGLSGLSGIPPMRRDWAPEAWAESRQREDGRWHQAPESKDSQSETMAAEKRSGALVLRPLLGVTRRQIEAYCRHYGLSYVEDSSNRREDFLRNRIRHRLIPEMEAMNPRFLQGVIGMTAQLREDREFMAERAEALLAEATVPGDGNASGEEGLRISVLEQAPAVLCRRALKGYLEARGCGRLSSVHLMEGMKNIRNRKNMSLPGGRVMRCDGGMLRVTAAPPTAPWRIRGCLGETLLPMGKRLVLWLEEEKRTADRQKYPLQDDAKEVTIATQTFPLAGCPQEPLGTILQENMKVHNLLFKSVLDYDTIKSEFVVRSRGPGDRFSPGGRGLSKSMKQLFSERSIPVHRRNDQVLLATDKQVFFAEGVGVAEGFQATEATRRRLWVAVFQGETGPAKHETEKTGMKKQEAEDRKQKTGSKR